MGTKANTVARPDTRPLLSVQDLAALVGVPVSTVYRWRTRGDGPRGIRVGKHVRFRQADVDAWLDSLADEPSDAA